MDEGIFWGLLAAAVAVVVAFLLARRFLAAARGAASAEGFRPSREGAPVRNRVRVAARAERPPLPVFEPPRPPVIQGPGRPRAAGLFSGDTPLLLMQPVRGIDREAFLATGARLPVFELPFLAALSLSDAPPALPLPEGKDKPVPAPLIEVALPQVGEVAADDLAAVGFGEKGLPFGTPAGIGHSAGAPLLAWRASLKAAMERPWLPRALKAAAAAEASRLSRVSLALSPRFENDWGAALGFLKQALAVLAESDAALAALLSARCEAQAKVRLDAILVKDALTEREALRLWREYGVILELWRAALPVLACEAAGRETLPHAEAALEKALAVFLKADVAALLTAGSGAEEEAAEAPARPDPLEAEKARAGEALSELFSALDRSAYALSLMPRFAIREDEAGFALLRLDATAEGFQSGRGEAVGKAMGEAAGKPVAQN